METMQVVCYSDVSNGVIIQTPGRHFPGLVIQGDTLRSLCRKAERAIAALETGDDPGAKEYLLDLVDILRDRLLHYETVLKVNAVQLPYPDPVSD